MNPVSFGNFLGLVSFIYFLGLVYLFFLCTSKVLRPYLLGGNLLVWREQLHNIC